MTLANASNIHLYMPTMRNNEMEAFDAKPFDNYEITMILICMKVTLVVVTQIRNMQKSKLGASVQNNCLAMYQTDSIKQQLMGCNYRER